MGRRDRKKRSRRGGGDEPSENKAIKTDPLADLAECLEVLQWDDVAGDEISAGYLGGQDAGEATAIAAGAAAAAAFAEIEQEDFGEDGGLEQEVCQLSGAEVLPFCG